MTHTLDVAIVGGGAVGANAALFAARRGLSAAIIESGTTLLSGSPQVSFINHSDGFEYYKPGHRRTGKLCVDGTITKAMIYPMDRIATGTCSTSHPLRFFLSTGAVEKGLISERGFIANAHFMKSYYQQQIGALATELGRDELDIARQCRFNPSMGLASSPSSFRDASGMALAVNGSSFGVNMGWYYACLVEFLRLARVQVHLKQRVASIARVQGGYTISTDGDSVHARVVVLAASHGNQSLAYHIEGADRIRGPSGTFYLNAMTFLSLPSTSDTRIQEAARRVNFTLQQDSGGMYACLVPPNAQRPGLAAVYYPSSRGSQLSSHTVDSNAGEIPTEWRRLIDGTEQLGNSRLIAILGQAKALYPFLRDYASISHTVIRPVFNAGTPDSACGIDRRVRDIPKLARSLVSDGSVSCWSAPKWTNAELVGLMVLDHCLAVLGLERLPTSQHGQYGPIHIRLAETLQLLDFPHIEPRLEDALHYAEAAQLPESMMN